jgi:hypothetical protein
MGSALDCVEQYLKAHFFFKKTQKFQKHNKNCFFDFCLSYTLKFYFLLLIVVVVHVSHDAIPSGVICSSFYVEQVRLSSFCIIYKNHLAAKCAKVIRDTSTMSWSQYPRASLPPPPRWLSHLPSPPQNVKAALLASV